MAEYLVNGLVPSDPAIRLGAQQRSYDQSVYRLEYVQAAATASAPSPDSRSEVRWWLAIAALLPVSWIAARRVRRRVTA